MENQLIGGDYVPDGAGGFVRQTGSQALLSQALFHLSCRRGQFPLLPELGSLLYTLAREKPAGRAMAAQQYAQQALEPLGLEVRAAEVTAQKDGTLAVALHLRAGEENWDLEVVV